MTKSSSFLFLLCCFIGSPSAALRFAFADQGLKLSFRLTARLNTRCSGVESLLSAQK